MATIGVVLSGCGFLDGTEIHEATLTLLYLDALGVEIRCMAPDTEIVEPIDHAHKQPANDARNVLAESARIARTEICDIATVQPDELDGLIFPGGFGAAKNLCDWATKGPACDVHPEVARLVLGMHVQKKPMGFICIAPVIAARMLGETGVTLTIGNDSATAAGLEATGARHADCTVDEIVVDPAHKIVTTPAYMLGPSIAYVAKGIKKLVRQVVDWS